MLAVYHMGSLLQLSLSSLSNNGCKSWYVFMSNYPCFLTCCFSATAFNQHPPPPPPPANRPTGDAISIALHTALSHLDKNNNYVRMLFIDYSSAFNTIVPTKLITKLRTLGLNTSLSTWILDFLTGFLKSFYPQAMRLLNN